MARVEREKVEEEEEVKVKSKVKTNSTFEGVNNPGMYRPFLTRRRALGKAVIRESHRQILPLHPRKLSRRIITCHYSHTATMPKVSLEKVHKQISKKRGVLNIMHENSRDAHRLRKAGARVDRLSRHSHTVNRARQPYSKTHTCPCRRPLI